MLTRLAFPRSLSWADLERALPLLWLGLFGWALYHLWVLWGLRYYHTLYDFQAFYCGGKAVLAHANPYLNQPLHACEAAVSPDLFGRIGNVTIPNPLPPYAFFVFLWLANVAWPVSAGIWTGTLLAAIAATIFFVHRLTKQSFVLVAATMMVILAVPSLMLGSLAPLPILFSVLAAYTLKERRWTAATVFLALGMIEPHVMLPACVAVFAFVPAMRYRLCIAAAALVLTGVALVGPAAVFSYPHLLSVHALSEVSNTAQYSLTWLLHDLGLPAAPAVLLGSVQYAAMCVAGVLVARRLARAEAEEDLEFYVTAPIAFAIIGGNFIHITQMGYAMPLLFGLSRRSRTAFIPIALLCLAVPWQAAFASAQQVPLLLLPLLYIARAYWRVSVPVLLAIAGIIIGAEFIAVDGEKMVSLLTTMVIVTAPHSVVAPPATALSDVTWAKYLGAYPASNIWIPDKLLTWAGLIAMLFAIRPPKIRVSVIPPMRQVFVAATVALAVCTIIGWPTMEASFRNIGMGDFRAFSCAASVALHHANPYVFGPLYRCESAVVWPTWFYTANSNIALPAPLPPYALALFSPFVRLPFAHAASVWQFLVIAAALGSAWLLSRMTTTVSRAVIYLVLLVPTLLTLLPFGELTSIALLGLVAAAYFLSRERYWACALALMLAATEPHIAFPVFIGLFVVHARTRIPLLAAASVLVVGSVLFVGPAISLQYVTTVLPAHALSEIGRTSQLSLSSALYALGTPAALASRIGDVSFVVMAALGIYAGALLSRRYDDVRFAVFVPAASVLLGGPFIHINQIAMGLPFALVLFDKQPETSRQRSWLAFTLIALAIPWESMAITPQIAVPCFAAGLALLILLRIDMQQAVLSALVVGGAWFLLTAYPPPLHHRPPVFPSTSTALAEQNWAAFVMFAQSHWDMLSTCLKVPTWAALGALLGLAFAALRPARTQEKLVSKEAVLVV